MIKRISIAIVLLVAAVLTFSFEASDPKTQAVVNRYDGLYVFADCRPVTDYTVLGSVTMGAHLELSYPKFRDRLVKNTREQFTNVDGIILHFESKTAEAIKFK